MGTTVPRTRAARWQNSATRTRQAAAAAADALQSWTLNARATRPAVETNGHEFGTAPGEGRALPGVTPTSQTPRVRRPIAPATAPDEAAGAVLALPQPDWLFHELTVTGSAATLATFRAAAAGAGIVPWVHDYDRMEEDWFLLLMAPPPHRRTISAEGARILARGLRNLVWERHEMAVSRVGVSTACPFDLHSLVPVPDEILRLGDDDPKAIAWLWANWGTTWTPRRVAEQPIPRDLQRGLPEGRAVWRVSFWAADWSPWRAIRQIGAAWPELELDLRPSY